MVIVLKESLSVCQKPVHLLLLPEAVHPLKMLLITSHFHSLFMFTLPVTSHTSTTYHLATPQLLEEDTFQIYTKEKKSYQARLAS